MQRGFKGIIAISYLLGLLGMWGLVGSAWAQQVDAPAVPLSADANADPSDDQLADADPQVDADARTDDANSKANSASEPADAAPKAVDANGSADAHETEESAAARAK